ncbi:MAG: hypothetical protein WCG23_05860 [bacterium]
MKNYATSDVFYTEFKNNFNVNFNENNQRKNLWEQYSEFIISASTFLSDFADEKEFESFSSQFKNNSVALPKFLAKKIKGFGFALACDCLKELEYSEYPKPDKHLQKIFFQLGLSQNTNDYEVYNAIIEMANSVNQTPCCLLFVLNRVKSCVHYFYFSFGALPVKLNI